MPAIDEIISNRLLQSDGELVVDESQDSENRLSIKGFASVEILDRDAGIVSPFEFNTESFLDTGTLLENHEFLKEDGVRVSAGVVNDVFPATLRESAADSGLWDVVNLNTGEVATNFPKQAASELNEETLGLFVKADVTHEGTKKRISEGRLKGLSWRGLVRSVLTDEGISRLFDIELLEISVVPQPAVGQATFVVGKNVGSNHDSIFDYEVFKFRYPKKYFKSSKQVKKHAKSHNLDWISIHETKDNYFVNLCDYRLVENEEVVPVSMGSFDAFLCPLKGTNKTKVTESEDAGDNTVDSEEVESKPKEVKMKSKKQYVSIPLSELQEKFPDFKFVASKSVAVDEENELELAEVSVEDLQLPEEEETDETKANSESDKVLEIVTGLADKISDLYSKFDELTNKQEEKTAQGEDSEESSEQGSIDPDEFTQELSKSVEALIAENDELKQRLEKNEESVTKANKLLEAMKSLTPGETRRSERQLQQKSLTNSKEINPAELFSDWFQK